MINATQSLYMQHIFGTTGEQYGFYLALAGLIGAFNMGFLVQKFWLKFFSHKHLVFISHAVLFVGYSAI